MHVSRAVTRRRSGVALTLLLVLATLAGLSPFGGVPPAGATPGSATCTEVSGATTTTWKVNYDTASTAFGTAATVTSLKRSVNGAAETDVNGLTWELRYDNTPGAWPAPGWSPPGSSPPAFTSVTGTLTPAGIGRQVVLYLSPRLVTPDGACTVYLFPFSWNSTATSLPKIAVLGDDLLYQLNDSTTNNGAIQGHVERRLSALNIRMEVEGQPGRRWTDTAPGSDLVKADSYLLDEFRGLLEHDIDGAVVGLGINDALYVAAGVDQPARDARLTEVSDGLLRVGGEMTTRTPCLAALTIPQNVTSIDGDYDEAAIAFNNLVRFFAAPAGDSMELVDFGADAATHKATDPQPWFTADNLHLNAAGVTAYADAVAVGARRCADSVVLWGKAGTLARGDLNGRSALPTGQSYNARSSAPIDYEAGKAPWFGTITSDGTIFNMTVSSSVGFFTKPTGEGFTVSALNPDAGTFQNVKVKTDRGVLVPLTPDGDDAGTEPDDRLASDGLDVAVLSGGNAVAFTAYTTYGGQPLENCGPEDTTCGGMAAQGQFPAFGILTKGAGGQWGVAEGAGWRNSWSPRELVAATVAADPVNGQAMADIVCPVSQVALFGGPVIDPSGQQVRDCTAASEMAVLPSGDIAIAHYYSGSVSVIDVAGPDASGRYTARIAATYKLPVIDDPSWPDALSEPDPYLIIDGPDDDNPPAPDGGPCEEEEWFKPGAPLPPAEADRKIGMAPREVQADPTSTTTNDQRFALETDSSAFRYTSQDGPDAGTAPDGCVHPQTVNGPLVEFQYNPAGTWNVDPALNTRLRPISAPVWSGETRATIEPFNGLKGFVGSGQFQYDYRGNLWVAGDSGVKMWAKTASGRRINNAPCKQAGTAFESYVIPAATATAAGARTTWGTICPADYLFPQAKTLGNVWGIEENPLTHDIVAYGWPNGNTMVIDPDDPDGDGLNQTFRMSNLANPIAQRVDTAQVSGPCIPPATGTCTAPPFLAAMQVVVDPSGRMWEAVNQVAPPTLDRNSVEMATRDFDQWFYSVDLSKLAGREGQRLTARTGQFSVLQGEAAKTVATTQSSPTGDLRIADRHVDPVAGVASCASSSCNDGATSPLTSGALSVGNDAAGGLPSGTSLEYRVTVPKGGTYQLVYRAADLSANGTAAQVRMTVDGGTPRAPVTISPTSMTNVTDAATVTLAAGTHTLVLSAPSATTAGWQLDWVRFTRQ